MKEKENGKSYFCVSLSVNEYLNKRQIIEKTKKFTHSISWMDFCRELFQFYVSLNIFSKKSTFYYEYMNSYKQFFFIKTNILFISLL